MTCRVPDCSDDADLYAAGWLCDDHRPRNGVAQKREKEKAK